MIKAILLAAGQSQRLGIENKLIKEYYNENISSFQTEEKRLIDMLSFSNEGSETTAYWDYPF